MPEHWLVEVAPVINSPGYPRRPQYAATCACGHVDIGLCAGHAREYHARHAENPERAQGAGDAPFPGGWPVGGADE